MRAGGRWVNSRPGIDNRGLAPIEAQGRGLETAEDRLEVGGVHVIGDAEIAVALHLGPAPQLRRQEFTVAVQGMGVQINHDQ